MSPKINLDRRTALLSLAMSGAALSARANAASEPARGALVASRPPAPKALLVYDAIALLEKDIPHGKTPLGERFRVPIIGGEFSGPDIRGRILSGGEDWQLLRGDGYLELVANYFMETDDGVLIRVTNRGLFHAKDERSPPDYAMASPTFEVPIGKYSWLNQHIFACTVAPGPATTPSVHLTIYKLV